MRMLIPMHLIWTRLSLFNILLHMGMGWRGTQSQFPHVHTPVLIFMLRCAENRGHGSPQKLKVHKRVQTALRISDFVLNPWILIPGILPIFFILLLSLNPQNHMLLLYTLSRDSLSTYSPPCMNFKTPDLTEPQAQCEDTLRASSLLPAKNQEDGNTVRLLSPRAFDSINGGGGRYPASIQMNGFKI